MLLAMARLQRGQSPEWRLSSRQQVEQTHLWAQGRKISLGAHPKQATHSVTSKIVIDDISIAGVACAEEETAVDDDDEEEVDLRLGFITTSEDPTILIPAVRTL